MGEITELDRALGAYLGLAVGDALGATVEFMTAQEIAATYRIHQHIIGGGWLRLRPGQVTDDTQMCLALGRAILSAPSWELKRAADEFVAWMRTRPVDIGNTVRRGLRRYLQNGTLQASPAEEDAGNGALMRNLPLVLANLGSRATLHARSLEQARITHAHPLSDAAVVAFADITALLLQGEGKAAAFRRAEELVRDHPVFRFTPYPGMSSPYVVDTVQTVFDAFFTTESAEACIVRAVNRGGDADTSGALAGQLAGAHYGIGALPSRWLRHLDHPVVASIRTQVTSLLALSPGVHPVSAPRLVDADGVTRRRWL